MSIPDLVDGAGDEARDVLLVPEDVREGGGEGGRGLHGGEHDLANVRGVVEAEDALHLRGKRKTKNGTHEQEGQGFIYCTDRNRQDAKFQITSVISTQLRLKATACMHAITSRILYCPNVCPSV